MRFLRGDPLAIFQFQVIVLVEEDHGKIGCMGWYNRKTDERRTTEGRKTRRKWIGELDTELIP